MAAPEAGESEPHSNAHNAAALASAAKEALLRRVSSSPEVQPTVGQHVYLAGTGQWWSGQHFGAVIVDVRDEDQTVKVRYTDGGYKRFAAADFREMVVENRTAPERWEEWHSLLPEEDVSELSKLHDDIVNAHRKQNKDWAEVLERRYEVLSQKKEAVEALQVRMRDAVGRGDFLLAHQLQQEMNRLEGRTVTRQVPFTPALQRASPSKGVASSSSSGASPGPSSQFAEALEQGAVRALGGGLAGAAAMLLQVGSLMWLRTTMNYQYRHGMSMSDTMRTLYNEGGIRRFYRGIGPAVVQGPLARFTDTAANAGVLAFFEGTEARGWPVWVKTAFASGSAALVRICLVPLDTIKTVMQVEGKEGFMLLARKYRSGGATVLFHGAMATSAATFVSHYPWFTVFNTLDQNLPQYADAKATIIRNASIGFSASVCSDTVSNSFRVLKTCRQTRTTTSYRGLVQTVVAADGYLGLFSRGLKTRIITNGCSGVVFSCLYKAFEAQTLKR